MFKSQVWVNKDMLLFDLLIKQLDNLLIRQNLNIILLMDKLIISRTLNPKRLVIYYLFRYNEQYNYIKF
jgi:hypothetical protein